MIVVWNGTIMEDSRSIMMSRLPVKSLVSE